jgi:hypothetical protein
LNKDGSVTCTETYKCKYSVALALAPRRRLSRHPIFPSLTCEEVRIVEGPGGIADIIVTYIGLAPDGSPDLLTIPPNEAAPLPDPVYELSVWGGESPITEYPNFATTIGATANGAVYDSSNVFTGWSNTSPYFGIESFLTARVVWRELFVTLTAPTATALNQIDKRVTPSGPVPTAGGSRNWLLTRFDYAQEGEIYRCVREWTLSNPTGWNANVYAAG